MGGGQGQGVGRGREGASLVAKKDENSGQKPPSHKYQRETPSSESAKQPTGRTKGTHTAWLLLWPESKGCLLKLLNTKRNPLQDLGPEFPFIKRPPESKPKSVFNVVTKQNFFRLKSGFRGISHRMYLHNNNKTTPLRA